MNQPRDKQGKFMSNKEETNNGEGKYKGLPSNWDKFVGDGELDEFKTPPIPKLDVDLTCDDMQEIDRDPFDKTLAIARPVELKGIHLQGYGIVYAGPYALRPKDLKGIKLAPEVPGDYDYMMCIKDFGIPSVKEMDLAILTGLKYFQECGTFYVGCMMGQGRTGTYLACFLKVFGYQKPIEEVRALYNKKAVETLEQKIFVESYPIEKFEYLVRFLSSNQ